MFLKARRQTNMQQSGMNGYDRANRAIVGCSLRQMLMLSYKHWREERKRREPEGEETRASL